jgi:hypothetical protein
MVRHPDFFEVFDEAVWFSGDLRIFLAELLIKDSHHVLLNKIHFALKNLGDDRENILAHHARVKGELDSGVLHERLEEAQVAISEIRGNTFHFGA